jgi:hypothetical protein
LADLADNLKPTANHHWYMLRTPAEDPAEAAIASADKKKLEHTAWSAL